jgi:hypothetical protein
VNRVISCSVGGNTKCAIIDEQFYDSKYQHVIDSAHEQQQQQSRSAETTDACGSHVVSRAKKSIDCRARQRSAVENRTFFDFDIIDLDIDITCAANHDAVNVYDDQ